MLLFCKLNLAVENIMLDKSEWLLLLYGYYASSMSPSKKAQKKKVNLIISTCNDNIPISHVVSIHTRRIVIPKDIIIYLEIQFYC